MTMANQDIQSWAGRTAVGAQGEKLGEIADIYLDDQTNTPEWLALSTGLFGARVSFVPLQGATEEAGDVRVPFSKDQVKDAPNAEADGHLSMEEEARLYQHYGLPYSDAPSDSGLPAGGAPRGGPDDAVTVSEEQLRVGKTSREAGRARLRKWVETERVSQTVPVAHEEVRVEREPITEANVDKATAGPEITEDVHEVPLMEEEAVAAKQTVPKERVRLEKDTVTEEAEVGAELRKERVEAEVDPPQRRRP
jgi:uncharacterized protein (TIGR02271 family)